MSETRQRAGRRASLKIVAAFILSGIALSFTACKTEPNSEVIEVETAKQPTKAVDQKLDPIPVDEPPSDTAQGASSSPCRVPLKRPESDEAGSELTVAPAYEDPLRVPHGIPLTTVVKDVEKVREPEGELAATVEDLGAGTVRVSLTNVTAYAAPEPTIVAYQQEQNIVLDFARPARVARGMSRYNLTLLIGPLQSDAYRLRFENAREDLAHFKVSSVADEHFANMEKRERAFAVNQKGGTESESTDTVTQTRYGAASYVVTLKEISTSRTPYHTPYLFAAYAEGDTLVVETRRPPRIYRCGSTPRDYELVVNTGSFVPTKTIFRTPY